MLFLLPLPFICFSPLPQSFFFLAFTSSPTLSDMFQTNQKCCNLFSLFSGPSRTHTHTSSLFTSFSHCVCVYVCGCGWVGVGSGKALILASLVFQGTHPKSCVNCHCLKWLLYLKGSLKFKLASKYAGLSPCFADMSGHILRSVPVVLFRPF